MTPIAPLIGRDRMAELLRGMTGRRVAIVGDVMLDRYLIGDTDRLSPEAPVPVVTVRHSRLALGGAANVAANVAALGARALLAGVIGDDAYGTTIRTELAVSRLSDRYLVPVADRPTTTKTRVIARGQQVVRIDEESDEALSPADQDRLVEQVRALVPEADALVLEDYNKGVLEPPVIRAAIEIARARSIPVVVDPKFAISSTTRAPPCSSPIAVSWTRPSGRPSTSSASLTLSSGLGTDSGSIICSSPWGPMGWCWSAPARGARSGSRAGPARYTTCPGPATP